MARYFRRVKPLLIGSSGFGTLSAASLKSTLCFAGRGAEMLMFLQNRRYSWVESPLLSVLCGSVGVAVTICNVL